MALSAGPAQWLRAAWCVAAVLAAAGCCGRQDGGPLPAYVSDEAVIRYEFRRFLGREADAATLSRIASAAKAARAGDYRGALATLSADAPGAPVPAVFANLGILYAAVNDPPNARESFEKALRREPGYRTAREGLERLKASGVAEDLPVRQEVEPNDSPPRSNRIALDTAVNAEVSSAGDVDAFRFVAPPKPRDVLEVSVLNRSTTLAPTMRISDSDQRFVLLNQDTSKPGANATQFFSPESGAAFFVEVWGQNRTMGAYAIRVRALKAYDAYEPNDDIVQPTPIQAGATLEAGIMDARDTDFYRFTSPRTGSATVVIENRSATLVPMVTLYDRDLRLTGFGPETSEPGTGLTHAFPVTAREVGFIQVWGRAESSGRYTISVK